MKKCKFLDTKKYEEMTHICLSSFSKSIDGWVRLSKNPKNEIIYRVKCYIIINEVVYRKKLNKIYHCKTCNSSLVIRSESKSKTSSSEVCMESSARTDLWVAPSAPPPQI